MRFFGTVVAWLLAGLVGYALTAIFSQTIVLNGLGALGAEIAPDVRLKSTVHAVLNMTALIAVVLLGYAIAFYVASLVKAAIPPLAPIAYPVAGAGAMFTALMLMKVRFGVLPILGAQEPIGFWLVVIAGAFGGLAFELMRPKERNA